MAWLNKLADGYVIQVCEAFLGKTPASEVAKNLTNRLRQDGVALTGPRGGSVSREQIYDVIREARRRGFFVLRAPVHQSLKQRIADIFSLRPECVDVVSARESASADSVASHAAEVSLGFIKAVSRTREPVHVGLGAGSTTLHIARHLADHLRADAQWPSLVLHALTSGFQVTRPQTAPVAFFGLFEEFGEKVDYVGLFAPPVVQARSYAAEKRKFGVQESFAKRGEIDVVITSLASHADPHGELNNFLQADRIGHQFLTKQGWVGDVQYCPYSSEAAIRQETGTRAVTLFELPELVTLASTPNRHVILASGPCRICGRTREDALYPLLRSSRLKLWTHLVLDAETAEKLVGLALRSLPR